MLKHHFAERPLQSYFFSNTIQHISGDVSGTKFIIFLPILLNGLLIFIILLLLSFIKKYFILH